jgi:hypothetical protein
MLGEGAAPSVELTLDRAGWTIVRGCLDRGSDCDRAGIFADDGPPIGSQVQIHTAVGGKTVSTLATISADRHKLESIQITPATLHIGDDFTVTLKARVAPAGRGFSPTATASNPDVIYALPPSYVGSASTSWQGSANGSGESDYTVKLDDQMVTTHVTVGP